MDQAKASDTPLQRSAQQSEAFERGLVQQNQLLNIFKSRRFTGWQFCEWRSSDCPDAMREENEFQRRQLKMLEIHGALYPVHHRVYVTSLFRKHKSHSYNERHKDRHVN